MGRKVSTNPASFLYNFIEDKVDMVLDTDSLKFAEREIVQEHQLKEKVINEEFKIWKKTVPLLYDTIYSHALESPSLSVQWLPDYTVSDNKNQVNVRFLYGTNSNATSKKGPNYLKLGSIDLPSTLAPDFSKFSPNSDSIPIPLSNSEAPLSTVKELKSWSHSGEINQLKVSPNSQNVITFDNKGIIHLYDINKEEPLVDFQYHKKEGYALEWVQESQFLSGAHDSQIALWDVSKPSTPIQLFKSHNGIINDLSHNANATSIFGSVANDYTAQIQDTRSSLEDEPAIQIRYSHHQNSIMFHPDIPTLVATGGKDNIVSLYDLRNTNEPVRKFFGHVDSVVGIKWDNIYDPSSLISWGLDNRVIIWDLNQLDEPFTYPTNDSNETNSRRKAKQAEDPCLKFVHGGHTNRINDIDIHPKLKNVFITAGDDHLLEIWKPKTIIVEDDDQEEEEEESRDQEDADNEQKDDEEAEKNTKDDSTSGNQNGNAEDEKNEDVEMKD